MLWITDTFWCMTTVSGGAFMIRPDQVADADRRLPPALGPGAHAALGPLIGVVAQLVVAPRAAWRPGCGSRGRCVAPGSGSAGARAPGRGPARRARRSTRLLQVVRPRAPLEIPLTGQSRGGCLWLQPVAARRLGEIGELEHPGRGARPVSSAGASRRRSTTWPPMTWRSMISSTSPSVTPPYQVALGIDHDGHAARALVEAAGLVGAHDALEPALVELLLEGLGHRERALVGAAAARILAPRAG